MRIANLSGLKKIASWEADGWHPFLLTTDERGLNADDFSLWSLSVFIYGNPWLISFCEFVNDS
jgi:hypothetical protein